MGNSSSAAEARGTCKGVDVGTGNAAVTNGWWAALPVGGKLYCVPCNAERLIVYDPSSDSVSGVDTRKIATGDGKWRSAVAIKGKIYGIPDRADYMLIYDVATGIVSGVSTASVAKGYFKWQSAVALGGRIYAIPYHADKMMVYDPSNGQVSGVPVNDPRGPKSSKYVASVEISGKICAVPAEASAIFVYDPVLRRPSYIDIQEFASGPLKWVAAVALCGKVYAVPCNANCILIYDPMTGRVASINTDEINNGPGKWVCAIAVGRKIYGIPDHADKLLVLDTTTNAVKGVDISSVGTGRFKWQSAAVLAGKIYAVPFDADKIMVIDPETDSVTAADTSAVTEAPKKWSNAAVLSGRVCGVPYDVTKMLVHIPESSFAGQEAVGVEDGPNEVNLHADIPKDLVHDFVAMWLSKWIYHMSDVASPPAVDPLSVGEEPVAFNVHWVHEEPMSGSPARLGMITATMPGSGEKILYLAFKGSSFLGDFVVNATVMGDYSPFVRAFADRTTFVHHGAYHAIVQLRVHKREALQAQLQEAFASGVRRMIVTGHSLGGQYSLAFLLDTFLELRAPKAVQTCEAALEPSPLLESIRAVVFGSPMCFGSAEGHDVRKDFADYMRERSVNYITTGDPAPRLWSELDIEGFMRYIAAHVQGNLGSMGRRFVDWAAGPGGLGKRAEDLLKRPDIENQLLRPARLYSHVSSIRLLAKGEFREWRPLGQEHIKLEDHSIKDSYVPAFASALDPDGAGTVALYEEDGKVVATTA